MPMNTNYLSVNTSAQSNLNTPWITSGLAGFVSEVSIAGALNANAVTARGATTLSGNLTLGGTVASPTTFDADGARFLSRVTTASVTSTIIADGELMVGFLSASSCRLCYRSGATTYTIIATTGAVL